MSAPADVPPAPGGEPLTTPAHPLLLFYDAECSFCVRWIARVLQADRAHRTRFAARQGRTFQRLAQLYPPGFRAESVVLVQRRPDGREDFFIRSSAIRKLIDGLPGFRLFAGVLNVVPIPISDLGYRIVARLRAPLFGKWADDRPPVEENRELFLD